MEVTQERLEMICSGVGGLTPSDMVDSEEIDVLLPQLLTLRAAYAEAVKALDEMVGVALIGASENDLLLKPAFMRARAALATAKSLGIGE